MAAGLGFKTFTTGEVLTAADVNGYLMQGVLVFASAAARNAAITSPQEGQFAFTKDTNGLWYYDGAAWVASGATGDIEGVTAGVGITGGGTSGTVTITNDMATTITAAGDLVVGTGSGTYDNLPIGTTAQVLTADTTVSPYKVKWATPASGGAFTLLSTTTLNSSNQVISSIDQTYKHLFITVQGMTNATGNGGLRVDCNSNASSAYYSLIGGDNATARTGATQGGQIEGTSANLILRTSTNNTWTGWFYNYTEANLHPFNVTFTYQNDTNNYTYATMSGAIQFGTAAAISSIRFNNYGGAFNGGTVKIYGVN